MSCDGDAHLVGDLESATSFEVLLVEQHLHVPAELCLHLRRQPGVDRHVALENDSPAVGEWLLTDPGSSPPAKESSQLLPFRGETDRRA